MLMERGTSATVAARAIVLQGLDDPQLDELLPAERRREAARGGRDGRAALCPPFDLEAYREGHLTPVFFGSALNNFGVRELLDGARRAARRRRGRSRRDDARGRRRARTKVTGFVFKIQANMDPKHRDRIAFVRLCSGHFQRGMKLHHVAHRQAASRCTTRCCSSPSERELAEEAWAGDIIGIPNHGKLRIGDALTEGEALRFTGIPSFAPELLRACAPTTR